MNSAHVSMKPSESSLNSLGFLKVFQDLPLPLSSVLFIISQVLAHVMTSGATLVFVLKSLGVFVVYQVPPFMMVLERSAPVLVAIWG